MKRLVETMYRENGDRRVVLVCHSMGCLFTYHLLLSRVPQEWKDTFVHSWITLAAPFGGATKALAATTVGINFHTELFSDAGLRDLERTFSSLSLIVPSAAVFADQAILSLPGRNYTAAEMPLIYQLMGDEAGRRMWEQSQRMQPPASFPHPGVPVHCLRSSGLPTPERLAYPDPGSFPRSPVTLLGDGDGTVNQISADVCLRWSASAAGAAAGEDGGMEGRQRGFQTQLFEGVVHLDVVRHPDVVLYITKHVLHANMNSK